MTFAIYHLRYPDDSTYYEYTINDLIGRYDAKCLHALVHTIKEKPDLLLADLNTLVGFYDTEDITLTPSDLTPIFTATYLNAGALRESLYSDLLSALPELML